MDEFESSPEFQALVVAATGKPERSMGESVIPAEPPQWSDVRRLASELLAVADRQLPLHIYLIQAEANLNGFTGFQTALQAMMHLLQNHWDEVYPAPDLDDPDDMYYARVNLTNELSEQPVFLDTIYRLPLVDVRGLGDFSTRDLDISAGVITGTEEEQSRCQEGLIRGAFAESDPEQLQVTADSLDALPGLCSSIEAIFEEKTGQHDALSLRRLNDKIQVCRTRFHEYAGEHLSSTVDDEIISTDIAVTVNETDGQNYDNSAALSSLSSRHMVNTAFQAVQLYYQTYEPSSPVRILVARTSKFVDMSFFEVLQALAPEHRDNLPALLLQLQKQPLAAVLNDCYVRHCAGETLSDLPGGSQAAESVASSAKQSGAASGAFDVLSGNSAGNGSGAPEISARTQVLETLSDIESYFLSAEPASPIPLIVAEIRKLVPKKFSDLVTEFSRLLPVAVASE